MAKIDQVNNGDSGLFSRTKLNQAMKSVEVDGTKITGDGNVGTELTVDESGLDPTVIPFVSTTPNITTNTLADAVNEVGNNTADNTRVINTESDFPLAVNGVITLEDNINYIIGKPITTENRFQLGLNNSMTARNPLTPYLIYTGTGDMFTGVDIPFIMYVIALVCPSAQAFNITGTNFGTFVLFTKVLVIFAQKWGTFNNTDTLDITNSGSLNVEDGISLVGTDYWKLLTIDRLSIKTTNPTCIGLDFGSSLHPTVKVGSMEVQGVVGTVGISGLPNSGNIVSGAIASVNEGGFIPKDTVTPLVGITLEDIRWSFRDNSGLMNSIIAANPYLDPNTLPLTVTIPNNNGDFYKINQGSWLYTIDSRLTITPDGDVINATEQDITLDVNGFVTMEKAGGGTNYLAVRVAYDDNPNDPQSTITENGTQNTQPTSVPVVGIFVLEPGKGISLWVANTGGSSNIIVTNAKFVNFRLF
jgi:hypothetical protein